MRLSHACAGLTAAAAAVVIAACGSGPADQLKAWDVEPPYLPPRDPSTLVSSGSTASAADARARARARAREAEGAGPAREDGISEGAPSDAEVAEQLREAFGGEGGTDVDRAAIDAGGKAIIPPTAPKRLVALMRGANEVARKPYVYGGGHGRNPHEIWEDSAYDCSGSISYALATAGYIEGPMASGPMMKWGKPGPGKWVTIYANESHAFMVVAGLRFDTSGRQNTGTRWQANGRSTAGFVARHPPGL